MAVVEPQSVQAVFERAPRMRRKLSAEVVGQLRLGQIINAFVEVRAHVPDRPRIRGNRLRPQALQLKAF